MRILGIDPGTNATGYGVIECDRSGVRHIAHGALRPPRQQTMAARLALIHAGLCEVIALHLPTHVVIEKIFVAASSRSALVLGQARGVALAAIGTAALPVEELSPQAIKLAVTGSGAAAKARVQAMVQRLLALETLPARDAADALAAAICRAHMNGALGRAQPPDARAPASETASEARRLWAESASRKRGRPRAAHFVLRTAR